MSTVSKKIMMGSGAVDAYEIDQSLIFDKTDAASLVRTPGSASNQRTWTWSGWVKRSETNGSHIFSMFSADGSSDNSYICFYLDNIYINDYENGVGTKWQLTTNRVFRDFGAWYHIVFAVDTTQGTDSNRLKLYVNGVQETSFSAASYPAQNYDGFVNSTKEHHVGTAFTSASNYSLGGQLAEVNFVDGSQLAPSSFGETNSSTGQWVPKKYSGSYGTNGFYLKFVSGALGTDSSGEGNNYTAANLADADVVTDTPTNNCMTLNPLDTGSSTLSQGNLTLVTSNHSDTSGTMRLPNTGKWYWEVTCTTVGGTYFGIYKTSYTQDSGSWVTGSHIVLIGSTGQKLTQGSSAATYMSGAVSNGDVVGVAVDCDNGKIFFADSNTWGDSGNPATGANPAGTFTASDGWKPGFYGPGGANAINLSLNFGQKTFSYTPPSGFSALTASNLPDPAIALPSAHFNTVTYTGNGSTQSISGVGHQPDFTWIKNRSAADSHQLIDAVRGATKEVSSDDQLAEATNADGLTAFDSNGFSLGDDDEYNTNTENYVSWNWKANGSGSSNSDGSISSTVSANQTAGFSIQTWAGNGAYTTVGHGLGAAPELIFYFARTFPAAIWGDRYVWTTAIDGTDDYLRLDTTGVKGNLDSSISGSPTTTTIPSWQYPSGSTLVTYAFASKENFSSIGSYTGNGSADGPMIVTGFRPAWLLVKRTDATNNWVIYDVKRNTFNAIDKTIYTDTAAAEGTYSGGDILSNGFKVRYTGGMLNTDGGTYLYMAFAESPFKTANAR